jgi:hypothetical protein
MRLKVMFIIAAVYGFVIGVASLLAPAAMFSLGGLAGSSGVLMVARFMGVANIGLALIAWLVRNADASPARDGVSMGFFVFFALHALTSLYGQFTDTSMSGHWVMALLQGLIAVGFFVAGRASMSTAKS